MNIPKHHIRYPTAAAIDSLAKRLNLPNEPRMQDWQWEVSDPLRIDEFLATYRCGELTEDERFVLMETMLDCCVGSDHEFFAGSTWKQILALLDEHIALHISSVWYWSCLEVENLEDAWDITPYMRSILERHREQFVIQNDDT